MAKIINTLKKSINPEEQELKDILKENIKRHRHRRNLSQFELASEMNISTNFLADIEAGNTWVSAKTLIKFAKAFEIEVYKLFKPEKGDCCPKEHHDEKHSVMDNFSRDLAVVVKKSIDKSIEHLRKQYSIN